MAVQRNAHVTFTLATLLLHAAVDSPPLNLKFRPRPVLGELTDQVSPPSLCAPLRGRPHFGGGGGDKIFRTGFKGFSLRPYR